MKQYKITLNENQMRAIMDATDLLQRVQLGQWREIQDSLPLKKDVDYSEFHQDMRIIGEILSKYMISNINGFESSLGIGNPNLPDNNGNLNDIHRCIRYKLAMERAVEKRIIESENSPRKFPEMFTVDYDPPSSIKWGKEPLITIERVNSAT